MSKNIVNAEVVAVNGLVVTVRVPANDKYHLSDGNMKLVPTKEVNFFIWNIPAKLTCPNSTAHCRKECYAVKSEKRFPETVLKARHDNWEMSKLPTFVDDMVYFILKGLKNQRKPKLIVRIHESGDFYSQEYADKWMEIIRKVNSQCPDNKEITFIAYTKSFSFFDGKELPKNFALRASVWDDTKESDKEIIARNGWNVYTAVEKFTDHDDFEQCRCNDCATCGNCWNVNIPLICCEIH